MSWTDRRMSQIAIKAGYRPPPRCPRYGVIILDPPWEYRNTRRADAGGGLNGTAEQHYATMDARQLYSLPMLHLAANPCVLLMWATAPHIKQALHLVDGWRFEYVTMFPWVKIDGEPVVNLAGEVEAKPQMGVGWWVRGAAEYVLVCRRGQPPKPATTFIGLLSPNFGHSRKPDNLYEYGECFPGPRLEMFARRRRVGWDAYGDQVEGSIALPYRGR